VRGASTERNLQAGETADVCLGSLAARSSSGFPIVKRPLLDRHSMRLGIVEEMIRMAG
jgi:hypothetical protein